MEKPLTFFSTLARSSTAKRLATSSILTAIVMAGGKVMALLSGIVLARLLGPEGYGIYAFAMASVGLLAVFSSLGLRQFLVRMVATYTATAQWRLLRGLLFQANASVFFVSAIVSTVVASAVFLFSEHPLAEQNTVLLWALAFLPVIGLSSLRTGAFEGLKQVALGKLFEEVLRPLIFLMCLFVMMSATERWPNPVNVMQVQLVAFVLTLIAGSWVLWRYIPDNVWKASRDYRSSEWIRDATPFFWLSGTAVLMNQTDIVMLGLMSSAEEVGLYRVATNMAMLTGFFLTLAGSVAAPSIAALHTQNKQAQLQKLIMAFSLLAFVGASAVFVIFLIWGESILANVFGIDFVGAWNAAMILAFGYLMSCLFGITAIVLNMMGDAKITAKLFAAAAAFNVLLNLLLIPLLGHIGAALALATTTIGWKFVAAWILCRRYNLGMFRVVR